MKVRTTFPLVSALLGFTGNIASALDHHRHLGTFWAPLGPPTCNKADDVRETEGNFAHAIAAVETPEEDGQQIFMAVGSSTHTDTHLRQGSVQLYKFDERACLWRPHVSPIRGESTEDRLGHNIALSCDANVMAVSGDISSSNFRAGFVQV